MEISGKIVEIFDVVQITDTFRKREMVVEYAENPQYPEFLKFEMTQDRCEQLDRFNAGQAVTVQFDLRGRKWTDPQGQVKYFNSLQAWRVTENAGQGPEQLAPMDVAPPPEFDDSGVDEIPF